MAQQDNPALAEHAKDAIRQGRFDQAASLLKVARGSPPRDAPSLRTLAAIATVLRDEVAAAEWLEAAIAAHAPGPAPAAWYRAYGESCATRSNPGEAITAFRAALEQAPEDAETWRWLGRVLRQVDDLPGAVTACRRAMQLSPGDWPTRGDLAVVLSDAGALDEAAVLFEKVAAQAGDFPGTVVAHARLNAHRGRRAQAISALEACLARHPSNVSVLGTLALLFRDEGRFDDSVAASRRAVELAPAESAFWCGLGRTLLEAGRADEALRVAVSYLGRKPCHAGALSLQVLSLLALGDESSAEHLLDYERFVVCRTLPVPEGYADLASFNAELGDATTAHPTLHHAPLRHATAAGLHSGSLLIEPPKPIRSLQRALGVAVADYCRALPDWPEHPFVSSKPDSWDMAMWCVVMQRGGHQVPHIHPDAWLSGAYYPRLPEAVRSGAGPEGWFAFGEPDRNFPSRVTPRIVHVRPEEGLLVLFPSYFFHRTIPFVAEGTRVSVAFDVVARPALRAAAGWSRSLR